MWWIYIIPFALLIAFLLYVFVRNVIRGLRGETYSSLGESKIFSSNDLTDFSMIDHNPHYWDLFNSGTGPFANNNSFGGFGGGGFGGGRASGSW